MPVLSHTLRLAFLILFQGLVINRLNVMHGMMLPQIYLFGLMMLPFGTPRALVIAVCFAVGLAVDMFSNTAGMHAAAATLFGFMMAPVMRFFSPGEGFVAGLLPTLRTMGLARYLSVAFLLVFSHHFVLFVIEVFGSEFFGRTLLRIFISTLATVALMLLGQYIIRTNKSAQ